VAASAAGRADFSGAGESVRVSSGFCRLSSLAKAAGAIYTRYADDLAFSGDEKFERCVERFALRAAAILMEEGFQVHHRKTRVMRRGVRQYLAGIVTNERLNVVRADFDKLKAILTNCVRHGRRARIARGIRRFSSNLDGRVGFVEMVNPAKGQGCGGFSSRSGGEVRQDKNNRRSFDSPPPG